MLSKLKSIPSFVWKWVVALAIALASYLLLRKITKKSEGVLFKSVLEKEKGHTLETLEHIRDKAERRGVFREGTEKKREETLVKIKEDSDKNKELPLKDLSKKLEDRFNIEIE